MCRCHRPVASGLCPSLKTQGGLLYMSALADALGAPGEKLLPRRAICTGKRQKRCGAAAYGNGRSAQCGMGLGPVGHAFVICAMGHAFVNRAMGHAVTPEFASKWANTYTQVCAAASIQVQVVCALYYGPGAWRLAHAAAASPISALRGATAPITNALGCGVGMFVPSPPAFVGWPRSRPCGPVALGPFGLGPWGVGVYKGDA